MIKKLLVVALAVALVVPLIASARHSVVVDPNDTRGVLDIKRVKMVPKGRPKWKVTTFGRWNAEQIWDRGFSFVFVDTFGNRRSDYYVIVRSNGNRLKGALYRDKARGRDRRMRWVRVRHPKPRVVNIFIPFSKLRRRDSGIFRWYAQTMLSGKHCRQFCIDRAPNDGTITEPGPRPTPSVSTPAPTLPPPTPAPTGTPGP